MRVPEVPEPYSRSGSASSPGFASQRRGRGWNPAAEAQGCTCRLILAPRGWTGDQSSLCLNRLDQTCPAGLGKVGALLSTPTPAPLSAILPQSLGLFSCLRPQAVFVSKVWEMLFSSINLFPCQWLSIGEEMYQNSVRCFFPTTHSRPLPWNLAKYSIGKMPESPGRRSGKRMIASVKAISTLRF